MKAAKDIPDTLTGRDAELGGVIRRTIDGLAKRGSVERRTIYDKARASVERTIAARRAAGEAVDEAGYRRSMENAIRLAEEHYRAIPSPDVSAGEAAGSNASGFDDDISARLQGADSGNRPAGPVPPASARPEPDENSGTGGNARPAGTASSSAPVDQADSAAGRDREHGAAASRRLLRWSPAVMLVAIGVVLAAVIDPDVVADRFFGAEATSSEPSQDEAPGEQVVAPAPASDGEALGVLLPEQGSAPEQAARSAPATTAPKSPRLPEAGIEEPRARAGREEPASPSSTGPKELAWIFDERFIAEPAPPPGRSWTPAIPFGEDDPAGAGTRLAAAGEAAPPRESGEGPGDGWRENPVSNEVTSSIAPQSSLERPDIVPQVSASETSAAGGDGAAAGGPDEAIETAALPPRSPAIVVPSGASDGRSVEWTLLQQPPVGGTAPEAGIQADVSVPGEDMGVTMAVRRNADAAIPASHVIELIFTDGASIEGQKIVSVGPPSMRSSQDGDGEELMAFPFPIAPGHFVMTLSETPDSLRRNLQLLRTRDWIAFPLTLANGEVVPLVFEKGRAGSQVFEKAFATWQAKSRT